MVYCVVCEVVIAHYFVEREISFGGGLRPYNETQCPVCKKIQEFRGVEDR